MACLAEWDCEIWIAIPTGDVMLFRSNLASALKTAMLLSSSPKPSGGLDWRLIHHDEDSGTA